MKIYTNHPIYIDIIWLNFLGILSTDKGVIGQSINCLVVFSLLLASWKTLFTRYDSSLRLCFLTDLDKNLHGTSYICKYYVVKFSYWSVYREMSYGSECKSFGFFFNTLYVVLGIVTLYLLYDFWAPSKMAGGTIDARPPPQYSRLRG